jgi:hypothetical protein
MFRISLFRASGDRCAYLMVISMVACPINS